MTDIDDQEDREILIADVRKDIRELKKDVALNIATLTGITDIGDLTRHLKDTLWPTIEALVDRVDDAAAVIDDNEVALFELAEQQDDHFTADTAKEILSVFVIGAAIADALKMRLTPADPPELASHIDSYHQKMKEVTKLVEESTIVGPDEEDDEDE